MNYTKEIEAVGKELTRITEATASAQEQAARAERELDAIGEDLDAANAEVALGKSDAGVKSLQARQRAALGTMETAGRISRELAKKKGETERRLAELKLAFRKAEHERLRQTLEADLAEITGALGNLTANVNAVHDSMSLVARLEAEITGRLYGPVNHQQNVISSLGQSLRDWISHVGGIHIRSFTAKREVGEKPAGGRDRAGCDSAKETSALPAQDVAEVEP